MLAGAFFTRHATAEHACGSTLADCGWSSGDGVPSSGIIDLAIGLVLVFGVAAALSSAVTEGVARFCGLRGEFLLRGLCELLDGRKDPIKLDSPEDSYAKVSGLIKAKVSGLIKEPTGSSSAVPSATSALLGGPNLRNRGAASLGMSLQPPGRSGGLPELAVRPPWERWRWCRSLPSYIPAKSFAEAVVDLVVPDATGEITMATVRKGVDALPEEMATFKPSLQALVKNAGSDIGVFRASVERWFDHEMDHVSREYKRHVAKITLVAGAIFVVLFNINALTIGRYLYSGSAVNSALTSVAVSSTKCPAEPQVVCLADLKTRLSLVVQVPVGWTPVADCVAPGARCNWSDKYGIFSQHGGSLGQAAVTLIGLLLTIVALLPGARFWFNLLSRLRNALG